MTYSGESYRGRKPSYTRAQLTTVQDMLGQSANVIQIAKATNLRPRQRLHWRRGKPHSGRHPAAAVTSLRGSGLIAHSAREPKAPRNPRGFSCAVWVPAAVEMSVISRV
jgi:hypothetical protein